MAQVFEPVVDGGQSVRGYKRDAQTKIIYRIEMVSGEYFRFSTGETEFSRAQKMANAKVAQFFRIGDKAETLRVLVVDELVKLEQHYLELATAGSISMGTYRVTKNEIAKLKPFWGSLYPSEITKEKWSEFQDWFDRAYPGQDQFNVTKTMKILISHLIEKGLLLRRPTIKDRNAKRRREMRKRLKARVLTGVEIMALDKACAADWERLALRLMYQMGFRVGDVVALTWDRISLNSEVPYIRFTEGDDKADFQGKCPITDDIVEILNQWPRESRYLYPLKRDNNRHIKTQIIDRMFRDLKDRAGVDYGSCHDLRHYRLTNDFKNPKFTAAQVCLVRRISLKTAFEHYIHPELSDLEMLRNAGSLKSLAAAKDSM